MSSKEFIDPFFFDTTVRVSADAEISRLKQIITLGRAHVEVFRSLPV